MNLVYKLERFKKISYWPEFVLAISLIISVCCLDLTWFNTHMSRDLNRAFEWIHLQPSSWLGPEMGWDYKRLPGPFYYFILGFFWLMTHSVEGVLFLKIIFSSICVFLLLKELKKIHSIFFVSLFSLQFVFMPVYIATIRNLWNPSLIIAFCCLIFVCALKYMLTQRYFWIWVATVTSILGMQIHFSVVVPYLAFICAVLFFKRHKKIVFYNIVLLSIWIFSWLYFNSAPGFDQQLKTFYGLNQFILNRFQDFGYHLSLSLKPVTDYDLFFMLTKAGVQAQLISSDFVNYLNPVFNFLYLVVFILSFSSLVHYFIKSKKINFVEAFALLWLLFFIVSYVVTKHKEQLPYRYGLCLYPIQFYLLCRAVFIFKKSIQKVIICFVILVSVTHLYFIYHFYLFQEVFGRTHHTHLDNLELTLKNKKYIYNYLRPEVSEDPLGSFHGRAINKMRLKEMNWEQTQAYFGLYKALTGKSIQYDLSTIMNETPSEAWLYQLKSLHQIELRNESSFNLIKMNLKQLPHNLLIKYLNPDGSLINSLEWKNTNLIVPLAFVKQYQQDLIIRIEFDIDTYNYKYLNVLIDDNAYYKFAYQPQFKIVDVKINSERISESHFYRGHFLVQNQYIYEVSSSASNSHVIIDLKPESILVPNFSRLDIFSTPDLLFQEELDESFLAE